MAEEEQLKRIADSLEKISSIYDDPGAFMQRAYQQLVSTLGTVVLPQLPAAISRVEVTLDSKEKEEIIRAATSEIEKQLGEFRVFVAQSLSELPESQLKRIGEHLKEGRKFKLRRRGGCIHLDFGIGDEEFYLKL